MAGEQTDYATLVKAAREETGMSVKQFAPLIDLSPSTLGRIENGTKGLNRIEARGLMLEVQEVLDGLGKTNAAVEAVAGGRFSSLERAQVELRQRLEFVLDHLDLEDDEALRQIEEDVDRQFGPSSELPEEEADASEK